MLPSIVANICRSTFVNTQLKQTNIFQILGFRVTVALKQTKGDCESLLRAFIQGTGSTKNEPSSTEMSTEGTKE